MDHIEYYHDQGLKYLKCTDVAIDGSMAGPAIGLYNKILNKFPALEVMASGGIRSVEDIEKLQEIGVYGVILAKALYDDKIKIKELERFLI